MKYVFTIVVLILFGYGLYYLSDTPKEADETSIGIIENNNALAAYLSAHISELSPEKEVLGGKFYITNITADAGTGTVLYEDGHNAFEADFSYSFTEKGEVIIRDFRIVQ